MSLFDIEVGNWGSMVLVTVLILFVLLYLAGMSSAGLIAGAVLLAVLAVILYYVGVRVDYWLKHGGMR